MRLLPLVACPCCSRTIRLRRRDCGKDFVHAECGAGISVPGVAAIRRGAGLALVTPPRVDSTESAGAPPASLPAVSLPRPALEPGRPDAPEGISAADLAAAVARLQELAADLTAQAAGLSALVTRARASDASGTEESPGNAGRQSQSAHARLVKGKADSLSLRETYRPLNDVDALRNDSGNARAIRRSKREQAFHAWIRKVAPWDLEQAAAAGENPSRPPLRLQVLVAGVAVLLLAVAAVSYLTGSGDAISVTSPERSFEDVLSAVGNAHGGAEKIALVGANIASVRQGVNNATVAAFLNDYLDAASWRERLPFVRKPDAVAPLMEHHYKRHPLRRGTVAEVQRVAFARSGQMVFVDIEATDNSGAPLNAAMELSDGRFALDWESFTAHSTTPLAEFLRQDAGSTAVFRVTAEPSFYFNYHFNAHRHVGLRVEEPFTETSCYAYVSQESELRTLLTDMVILRSTASDRSIRPTLQLRIPAEPHDHNQVWIDAVLSESWVVP